jgi:glycosyltransferase involved in cell wall biosynthesis
VVAPVPSFPLLPWRGGWPGPLYDEWQGLPVDRPRFFYVPGILKSLDGKFYARGLRAWLKDGLDKWRPDVLDAHFEWPDGVGVSLLASEFGLPYTITLRGWLYEAMGKPRILPQCLKALHGAAALISVSGHLASTAIDLGVPRDRIHVIPNGVDTDRFQPRDKREARQMLGLPLAGRLIASVAHLGPRKGNREIIHALAELPRDVRLVLVGADPAGGRNERGLRRLAAECGVEQRVILAGRQPYDRIPLYYNAADVSVLASYREGCPNVVLESLASGTPVIASAVGAVPDMIQDGENGRIVPPKAVEPLRTALADMLIREYLPQEVASSPAVRSWEDVALDVCAVLQQAGGASCRALAEKC